MASAQRLGQKPTVGSLRPSRSERCFNRGNSSTARNEEWPGCSFLMAPKEWLLETVLRMTAREALRLVGYWQRCWQCVCCCCCLADSRPGRVLDDSIFFGTILIVLESLFIMYFFMLCFLFLALRLIQKPARHHFLHFLRSGQ